MTIQFQAFMFSQEQNGNIEIQEQQPTTLIPIGPLFFSEEEAIECAKTFCIYDYQNFTILKVYRRGY